MKKEDLQKQITELVAVHEFLSKVTEDKTATVLSGALPFEASACGRETITTSFDIELTIPHDFPVTTPKAKEIGGKIHASYHHRYTNGVLCLAVPIAERCILLEEPTLLGFVNRLVIPYLYGYCFFRKHGYHPFGEAAHGPEAILSHYKDTLGLTDDLAALRVICFLFMHGYRGHHDCPCGSGRKVRKCHGPVLLELDKAHSEQSRREDLNAIFAACCAKQPALLSHITMHAAAASEKVPRLARISRKK